MDFGGLIWNADGGWVLGFMGDIGYSNIIHAELMVLYYGLCMAWELGIKDLMFYSDFNSVIKLILELVNIWHHYIVILHNIKEFLIRELRVQIFHIFREGNTSANYLPKRRVDNDATF